MITGLSSLDGKLWNISIKCNNFIKYMTYQIKYPAQGHITTSWWRYILNQKILFKIISSIYLTIHWKKGSKRTGWSYWKYHLYLMRNHQELCQGCWRPWWWNKLNLRSEQLWFVNQLTITMGFPGGTSGIELICQCRRHKRPGLDPWSREDPLEKGMATHSNIRDWRIPWTEESGGL